MKKVMFSLAVGALALSVGVAAQAQVTAEDMVKFRQSGYTFMAWNMGKIKAQAVDGSVPYSQEQVAAAANVIAAIANSGMGALYSPATLDVTGWKETRLLPAFFEEQDRVREVAVNFVQEANALQEIVAMGDQAEIAAQFDTLSKACKACHDDFRAK